jgi:hypothetical protein
VAGLAVFVLVALAAVLTLTDVLSVRADDPHTEAFRDLPDPADPAIAETAATVDGVPITLGRLQGAIATARFGGQAVSAREALDSLIDYELLYAEGLRRGLAPSDDEVASAIEETRKNVDVAAVEAALDYAAKGGSRMTADEYWSHPEYHRAIRKSVTVSRAQEALQGAPGASAEGQLAQGLSELRARADVVVNDAAVEKAW